MTVVFDSMHGDTVDMVKELDPKIKHGWLSKAILATIVVIILITLLLLGYATGNGIHTSTLTSTSSAQSVEVKFCPPLEAEYLNTSFLEEGHAFEGAVINLKCNNDHLAFPTAVICRRNSSSSDSSLQWSHPLPVCYPKTLRTRGNRPINNLASHVTCTGNHNQTKCEMSCRAYHVAVEEEPYVCQKSPCPAWTLGSSRCYMFDEREELLREMKDPDPGKMIKAQGCSCDKIILTSTPVSESMGRAAIWQSQYMGLYDYVGENQGKPIYQKNKFPSDKHHSSSYSSISYKKKTGWLIGKRFKSTYSGNFYGNYGKKIKVLENNHLDCPEKWDDKGTKEYKDPTFYSKWWVDGQWKIDKTISARCMDQVNIVHCTCKSYEVKKKTGAWRPKLATLDFTGKFERVNDSLSLGFLAPVYFNAVKGLYLYSHHHTGVVWEISKKHTSTSLNLKGVTYVSQNETRKEALEACPDNEGISWQWSKQESVKRNTTSSWWRYEYWYRTYAVVDFGIQVTCLE